MLLRSFFTSSRCLASILALLATFGWVLTTFAAPAAARPKAESEVAVPASFLASRLVRPVGAPAPSFRVVVDVPRAASARAARPKIAEGSGDDAVDSVARNYVETTLRTVPRLAEMNQKSELSFPLRLTPPAITPVVYPSTQAFQETPSQGFSTPKPNYPRSAKNRRASGVCQVKVTYSATGGRPQLVILENSSGDRVLDGYTVEWVLLTWRSAPSGSELTRTTTFVYVLR